ncbi:MAG: hypothetical protein IKT38_06935 [Clostridia bacterium]|nr:hypothetical protein [Clostridia bacterium]
MVKGVSKTIIEVNQTGSRFFDKIVFYVSPEYGNLNAKHLKRAASEFCFNYNKAAAKKSLRKRILKRRIFLISLSSVLFLALAITIILILT